MPAVDVPGRPPYQCRPGLGGGHGRPAEAGQLASRRGGCQIGVFAALAEPLVDAMESVLSAPGDGKHVIGLALLAVSQRGTDAGWTLVVPGRLDQESAGVAAADSW